MSKVREEFCKTAKKLLKYLNFEKEHFHGDDEWPVIQEIEEIESLLEDPEKVFKKEVFILEKNNSELSRSFYFERQSDGDDGKEFVKITEASLESFEAFLLHNKDIMKDRLEEKKAGFKQTEKAIVEFLKDE